MTTPIPSGEQGRKGIVKREVLTENWTDWIDYWAVDFDFENEWQSFRTKKNRTLEMKSVFQECKPGQRKLAVKVVDIFGNDTMTIVEVNIPKNGKDGSAMQIRNQIIRVHSRLIEGTNNGLTSKLPRITPRNPRPFFSMVSG